MNQDITEKYITISVGKAYAIVSGIIMGTAFVIIAYFGLREQIADGYGTLDKKLENVIYRVGVLEKIQDKRK
jgi:hypothetical protein